jgi:hypothetical protein
MVFAGETRVNNLGLNAQYFIKDYSNVKLFPTAVSINPNVIYGDIDYDNFIYSGIHYKLNDMIQFGVKISSEKFEIKNSDLHSSAEDTEDGYSLFGCFQPFNSLSVGAFFNNKGSEYSNKDDYSDHTFEEQTSRNEYAVGARFAPTNVLEVEASMRLVTRFFESKNSTSTPKVHRKPDGHNTFQIDGRAFLNFWEKAYLAPYFNMTFRGQGFTQEYEDKNNNYTYDESETNFLLGVSYVIQPADDINVFSGVGMRFNFITYKTDYKTTHDPGEDEKNTYTFPFFVGGVEAPLSKYFALRFSAFKNLSTIKEVDGYYYDKQYKDELKYTDKSFGILLGGQAKFRNYKIDLTVGDNFFGNQSWFSDYYQNENGIIALIGVTYEFDSIIPEEKE